MAMTPLGKLIQEQRDRFQDEHGVELSYADIARRGGAVITRGRVQQLAKDPIKSMPSPATLAALAQGLGVPERVVTEKALESAGYAARAELAEELMARIQQKLAEVSAVQASFPSPRQTAARGLLPTDEPFASFERAMTELGLLMDEQAKVLGLPTSAEVAGRDYGLAARPGTPAQVRIDAAEPDPNVDPPAPEDP